MMVAAPRQNNHLSLPVASALVQPTLTSPGRLRKLIVLTLLAVFILPVVVRVSAYAFYRGTTNWRRADWSSSGLLPPAGAYAPARVLVMSGRAGGIKGVLAVHSWIVIKPVNAQSWTRYDVVGWTPVPVQTNYWAADSRWFDTVPTIVADVSGAEAEALIPKIETAVKRYRYGNSGDYRIWPGPNSNTFVADILRAVPELELQLPPNAIGRDYRSVPYAGLTDSGTGIEVSLWGVLGLKLGWVEGFELNVLGLVAGFDWRHPAIKLPGYGRIGLAAASG
jgi:Protein of unknown function (DUF3750)